MVCFAWAGLNLGAVSEKLKRELSTLGVFLLMCMGSKNIVSHAYRGMSQLILGLTA